MFDIIKCKGEGCFLAEYCKRYTEEAQPTGQVWYEPAPFEVKGEKIWCEAFWDNNPLATHKKKFTSENSEHEILDAYYKEVIPLYPKKKKITL